MCAPLHTLHLIILVDLKNGPRQANLVLIAYASSEGSGEPAHPRSLARTFAARSYKQWIKRNLQTESQICGPSEWLGMRSWNLSWRNARRHKFAWRGSNEICHSQISLHKFDVKDCFKERFNTENKLVSYENIFRYNQPQKWAAWWKKTTKWPAQSDQSLRCVPEEILGPKIPIKCRAKTQTWWMHLNKSQAWSQSDLSLRWAYRPLCWFVMRLLIKNLE